ncbi:MAG: transporter substrate-binding domain-containing protein [Pseudomonadales bacterium]|nr:transporter substrate-binding domain-containing protein [Pseudomonadales bacterium]
MQTNIVVGIRKFVLISLIWLISCVGLADDAVIIAAEDSWPPFSDTSGHGISYNLVSAAFAKVNRTINIRVMPYVRALKYTERGLVDACWNVTRQPSTEALFHFGKEPLLKAQASYFYPKGKELDLTDPATIPDNLRIGVIIDYEYGSEYSKHKKRFKEVAVSSQQQLIKMLKVERIEAAIMFDEVAKYTLNEMGLAENTIAKGNINHISDIYVAFSKEKAGYKILSGELDKGLQALKASGEYERIFNINPGSN